jgi:hypothetical protein
MWSYFQAHQLVVGVVGMWLLANAIGAMPTPKADSSPFYEFLFKFAQSTGGGISRVLAVYSPNTLTALTGQSVQPSTKSNGTNAANAANGTSNGKA